MQNLLLRENKTLNGRLSQSHVLLVEDRPEHVWLIKEALCDVNGSINLHVAADGLEAMAFLRHQDIYADAPRPDLVLLDLNLPRMDGREVLALIKNDIDLKMIPTIILTASEMHRDIVAGYQLHANAYLRKPIEWHGFVRMLRSLNDFWLSQSQLPPRNLRSLSHR